MLKYFDSIDKKKGEDWLCFGFLILFLFYCTGRLFFIFNYNINWDEFLYLSQIHSFFSDGSQLIQRGHVYLFFWLKWVPGDEINQIIFARFSMMILQAGTMIFIYTCSRAFFGRFVSLFCVWLYASAIYVLWQGTSFRADPIAIFFLMGALHFVLRRPHSLSNFFTTGAFIGLAGTVTIKSIFLAVPIGLVLFIKSIQKGVSKSSFLPLFVVAASAIAIFLLYLSITSHISALSFYGQMSEDLQSSQTIFDMRQALMNSIDLFIFNNFTVTKGILVRFLTAEFIFTAFFFCSVLLLLFSFIKPKKCAGIQSKDLLSPIDLYQAGMLLVLCLPFCTLFFYRNVFVYYDVFLLPPLCIVCGVAISLLKRELGPSLALICFIVLMVFLIPRVWTNLINRPQNSTLSYQSNVIETVHKIFPRPVHYISRTSMISSFPRVGFFMSGAGFILYNQGFLPDLEDIIVADQPKFIIGHKQLETTQAMVQEGVFHRPLKLNDKNFIARQYIPHWRELYVAGKDFFFSQDDIQKSKVFQIYIPGYYTIETQDEVKVIIDGEVLQNNDIVLLELGEHQIKLVDSGRAKITLRWGSRLYKPHATLHGKVDENSSLFYGF